jgi:hypothetical protein
MAEIPKNYLKFDDSDDDDEESDGKKEKSEIDSSSKQENSDNKKSKSDFIKELSLIIKGIEEKGDQDENETKPDVLAIDENPELETESPVEHLSEVEIEDISRTLARERLDDLEDAEVSPENNTAKEFLGQVIETGDIPYAESEIIATPILKDGEALIVRDPSSTGVESVSTNIHHETPSESKRDQVRSEKLKSANFLDYLIDRRKARIIKKPEKTENLDKKLSEEVDKLRIELAESERRIRVEVSNTVKNNNVDRELYSAPEQKILNKLEKDLDSKESRKIEKPVAVMSKNELIKVAENIKIDGTSLKKIYESHLISEKGLRRIISTFLRGGNVKRALNREILQRQIDFEKDPILRDSFDGSIEDNRQEDSKNESVDSLLEKRGINFQQQPAFYPINTIPKQELKKELPKNKKPKLIDVLFISVILVLFTLMLVLLLKK